MRTALVFSQTVGTPTNVVTPFSPNNSILRMQVTNNNGGVVYAQIFNLMVASVTVGTTVPIASIGFATASASPMIDLPDDGWFVGSANGLSIVFTTGRFGVTGASVDCNIWLGS